MARKSLHEIFIDYAVSASDFTHWVKVRHKKVDASKLYNDMLDNDYIEGSLGSRFDADWLTDEDREDDEKHWYDEYIVEFLKENKLEHVRFTYGG